MRYVSLFVLLFVTSNVMAQIIEDKEPAILEVHYIKTWVADTLENRSYSEDMTLRVGKTSAMFYPPKRMWVDSLLQTNFELHEKLYREMNPLGQAEYKPLGGLEREYLFRNINAGETIVARIIAGDHYFIGTRNPRKCPFGKFCRKRKNSWGIAASLPRAISEDAHGMHGFQPTYLSMKGLGNCSGCPVLSWKHGIVKSIMPTRQQDFIPKTCNLWG